VSERRAQRQGEDRVTLGITLLIYIHGLRNKFCALGAKKKLLLVHEIVQTSALKFYFLRVSLEN
jgi:hypothetical protein